MFSSFVKKSITTELDEKQFLSQLNKLCVPYRAVGRGYELSDVFAAKVRKNRFRFARRFFAVRARDLLEDEFLFGKYSVGENGKVEVTYRIGHRLVFLVPMCLLFFAGAVMLFSVISDTVALHTFHAGILFTSVALIAISLFEILYFSKKQTEALEVHLRRICRPEE